MFLFYCPSKEINNLLGFEYFLVGLRDIFNHRVSQAHHLRNYIIVGHKSRLVTLRNHPVVFSNNDANHLITIFDIKDSHTQTTVDEVINKEIPIAGPILDETTLKLRMFSIE